MSNSFSIIIKILRSKVLQKNIEGFMFIQPPMNPLGFYCKISSLHLIVQ